MGRYSGRIPQRFQDRWHRAARTATAEVVQTDVELVLVVGGWVAVVKQLMLPPGTVCRSTDDPLADRCEVGPVDRPPGPAPMTMTSASVLMLRANHRSSGDSPRKVDRLAFWKRVSVPCLGEQGGRTVAPPSDLRRRLSRRRLCPR